MSLPAAGLHCQTSAGPPWLSCSPSWSTAWPDGTNNNIMLLSDWLRTQIRLFRHLKHELMFVFSSNLIGNISEGEVGEGHASVSPQSDAVMITAQTEHFTVHLQQLRHRLQPACRDKKPTERQTVSVNSLKDEESKPGLHIFHL